MRTAPSQYSTYLGGSGIEGGVNAGPPISFTDDSNSGNSVRRWMRAGLVYVAGMTSFPWRQRGDNIPVTANALQPNLARHDETPARASSTPPRAAQSSLLYSSFLGGDHDTQGHSVAR